MAARGIRDRFREQMRREVKEAALRQLAEGGPHALSLNAIAKELGVSGPALYRYFAGRDALLVELVLDAYADLTAALTAAPLRPADLAAAYRSWGVAQPHRYRLLFTGPLPSFDAWDERVMAAARSAMDPLLRAAGAGPAPEAALARQLRSWAGTADPAVSLHALTLWSRLHGFVSLEIEGHLAAMGLEPDLVFAAELRALDRLISN
jgi:AcrR family transcriptional regulator